MLSRPAVLAVWVLAAWRPSAQGLRAEPLRQARIPVLGGGWSSHLGPQGPHSLLGNPEPEKKC